MSCLKKHCQNLWKENLSSISKDSKNSKIFIYHALKKASRSKNHDLSIRSLCPEELSRVAFGTPSHLRLMAYILHHHRRVPSDRIDQESIFMLTIRKSNGSTSHRSRRSYRVHFNDTPLGASVALGSRELLSESSPSVPSGLGSLGFSTSLSTRVRSKSSTRNLTSM